MKLTWWHWHWYIYSLVVMVKQVKGMRCLDQLMRNERTGAGTIWVTVTGSWSHAGAGTFWHKSQLILSFIMELMVKTIIQIKTLWLPTDLSLSPFKVSSKISMFMCRQDFTGRMNNTCLLIQYNNVIFASKKLFSISPFISEASS